MNHELEQTTKYIKSDHQSEKNEYDLKTERMIFEQRQMIREASKVFKNFSGTNYNCFKDALEKQILKLKEPLFLYFEKNETQIFQILQQLLYDNQLQCRQEKYWIDKDFLNLNVIILELSLLEQNTLLSLNQQSQKQYIKKTIVYQQNFFYKEQKKLAEKYQSIVEKQLKYLNKSNILVILVGLPANQNEIEKYLNQEFYLVNEILTTACPINHQQQPYNLLKILHNLFKKELVEIVNYLNREEYQKESLKQQLKNQKIQNRETSIEIYFYICEIIDSCVQIIKWNSVLQLQTQIIAQSFKCYDPQDENQSYKIAEKNQFIIIVNQNQDFKTIFQNILILVPVKFVKIISVVKIASKLKSIQKSFKVHNLKIQPESSKQKGKCCIIEHMMDQLCIKKLNFLASIKFSKDANLNLGEFGQIVLVDKEEGQSVINLNFELKPQTMELIHKNQQSPKHLEIIFDYLLRIMAVKSKRVIQVPILRLNPYQAKLII